LGFKVFVRVARAGHGPLPGPSNRAQHPYHGSGEDAALRITAAAYLITELAPGPLAAPIPAREALAGQGFANGNAADPPPYSGNASRNWRAWTIS
jgi:hypothetical protein